MKLETQVLFSVMPLLLPKVVQMIHVLTELTSSHPILFIIATRMSLPYSATFSNFPLSTEIRPKTAKSGIKALH